MKRWAVGYFSLFDNILAVEIVLAPTWQEAVAKHSRISGIEFDHDDLEKAKEDFFDCDSALDIKEITP
jgi:hypothetical protein